MYQGKNAGNIDIPRCAKQLPTTTKEVIDDVLASNSVNNNFESGKLFLNNRYSCTDLFEILFEDMIFIGGGTCIKNKRGFPVNDEQFTFEKKLQRKGLLGG